MSFQIVGVAAVVGGPGLCSFGLTSSAKLCAFGGQPRRDSLRHPQHPLGHGTTVDSNRPPVDGLQPRVEEASPHRIYRPVGMAEQRLGAKQVDRDFAEIPLPVGDPGNDRGRGGQSTSCAHGVEAFCWVHSRR